ncbi:MAG: hypothetical protein WBV94_00415 [Blastocatellia bacterium]
MLSLREQAIEKIERQRGWLIYLLYKAKPNPLELVQLIRLMDRRNYPLTRRRLAEEIDYLRSLRFVRVFDFESEKELDEVQQAKLIQRYADCESDEELGFVLCARITTAGINFQESSKPMEGIQRVE